MQHIVIAGGGVAGLEALLALRAMAGEHARLTLVAPDPEFVYKPLAIAEPFGLGHAHRVPLTRFAEEAGAELLIDALEQVDDGFGRARLAGGATLYFDQLIVATGGRPVAGVAGRHDLVARRRLRRSTAACCGISRRATPSGSPSSCPRARSGRCRPTSWR